MSKSASPSTNTSTIDVTRDWAMLLSFLPADWEQLADAHKQLETQYGNAKVTRAEDLLRFFFVHAGAGLPLRQTVVLVKKGGGPSLSPMRLHMKMRRAEPYLAALVAGMSRETARETAPEKWGGYTMKSVDASVVTGPGATGTESIVHTVINLSSTTVDQLVVTSEREGETLKRFQWSKGDLVIGDRGYSKAPGIVSTIDDGADVLIRLNRASLPLHDAAAPEADRGPRIDILAWVRTVKGPAPSERAALLHVGSRVIEGRLIASVLPAEQAQLARERLIREQGAKVTNDSLEMASYVVLFTTVPAGRLSAQRCLDAYTLRWQIELKFKRWKTIAGLDRLPNMREDTQRAWLYIKILLSLIMDRISCAPHRANTALPGAAEKEAPRTARSSSSPARPTTRPRELPLAQQPWKLATIVWPLVVSAILPMGLHDIIRDLPGIAASLTALDASTTHRQVDDFVAGVRPYSRGRRAPLS